MADCEDSDHRHEICGPCRPGLIRAAVCVPQVRVANPRFNAAQTITLAQQAHAASAVLALFPELGLTAYSNDDLFHQQALLEAAQVALAEVVQASRDLRPLLAVGLPLAVDGRLFNCAVAVHEGRVLAVVPKTYLANFREYYEKRQFAGADAAVSAEIELLGQRAPFGNDLLLDAADMPGLTLHLELCEDLWTPIPPSTYAALAGATVLLNLSASSAAIGKVTYRNRLIADQARKCIAAYLYSAAGPGESTTDLAWDGHAVIFEQARLLAESTPFHANGQIVLAEINLHALHADRLRETTFRDSAAAHQDRLRAFRRLSFRFH
ncbi:nitrilase-related carbon-nitrogen hydrolase [Thiohalocapsa sp. ML1]|jgi:NAD+ synthase (glutamine-hydrolysing)|uniref:nitrilase-related carbon-nitrogen hydrolase n=1 Tax=Thiohalocapsa sp. ML1 TaxID=1431688 RepID=UPI0007321F66|nr:nitrilase-related carbon-nitrogen hydrolase [Thiohalocapsa sp. ML1]